MSLPRWSLRNPYAVLALALLVAALGAFSLARTPTDLFPDTVPPQVVAVTVYPGAAADDVAETVTRVLEKELATVSGLTRLRSTSRDGVSSVSAEFAYEKPIGEAVVDVQSALARVRGALPAGAGEPLIYRVTDATRPLVTIALTPREGSLKRLTDVRLLAENTLKDEILAIPGVGDVQVFGGHRPEIEVRLDRDAMAARGVTLAEVVGRLAEQNVSAPAGTILGDRDELLVRVSGRFDGHRDIADLPLRGAGQDGGGGDLRGDLRLGDIATVAPGEADPRSLYHGDGARAIALDVLRAEGAPTVRTIDALKARLPELERAWPDIAFTITDDQQPVIDRNVSGMRWSIVQAIALTVLVIFLFLGDLRAAAAASVAIPLSFLGALVVLWFSPHTLNMVTLSGLIIAVGMVVDASVVVIENIVRHQRAAPDGDPREAAEKGAAEVAAPITAGMLTTVAVLVPVLFTRGFTGRIMEPLNLTIIATLVVSLAVSLTVVPLVTARLLARAKGRRRSVLARAVSPFGRLVDGLTALYAGLVRRALRHRIVTVVLTVAFVGVTMRLVKPLLGGEEMPPMDTGVVVVEFDTDAGASPRAVESTLGRVEAALLQTPGVVSLSSVVGSEPGAISFGGGGATAQQARLTVTLVDRTERERTIWQIQDEWRERLRQTEGVQTFRVSELGATAVSTTRAPLDVVVAGPDVAVLDRLADEVVARLRGTPGLVDLRRSWYRDKPGRSVRVSPQLARRHGTSPAAVAAELRAAVQGVTATSLRLDGFLDVPVRVRYRDDQIDTPSALGDVRIATRSGFLPLRALAEVDTEREAPLITREDLRTTVDVTGGNQGLTIAQLSARVAERLADLPLPAGYTLDVAGSAQDMADGQAEMGRALVIGLVLLFLLLLALFRSALHPWTIMIAIPPAVAGAIWGLLAFDKPFCKPALMGVILLGGTIVNNAILLLDFILSARREGVPRDEAVVRSVELRLRPILMTAVSTIVGFAPLILETAVGLERMSPLGIAAGAGLFVGTVVTTAVIPVVYTVLDDVAARLRRLAPARSEARATLPSGAEAPVSATD